MKRLSVILIVLLISVSVFAEAGSDVSLLLAGQVAKKPNEEKGIELNRVSLLLSETSYYYEDNKLSAPLVKVNMGFDIVPLLQENKTLVSFTAEAFGGYSVGVGPLMKVDLSGGVSFTESSIIAFVIKKLAKEDYSMRWSIAPAIDASVLFGLENVSLRAGLKGMYSFGNPTLAGKGLSVTPYVGLSVKILQAINIL